MLSLEEEERKNNYFQVFNVIFSLLIMSHVEKIHSFVTCLICKSVKTRENVNYKNANSKTFNPIQYGLFLKHYSMGGGGIMAPLVTLPFLKVEGQNLVRWVF